ncbi:unnamed protein product, partial [Musa acuminata subsp. malaccensis]
ALNIFHLDNLNSNISYLILTHVSFLLFFRLPGKAFADNQHIWLNGSQFANCKMFSRSLLAKSASIQTVVCIPIMDGVLELGTTDLVSSI